MIHYCVALRATTRSSLRAMARLVFSVVSLRRSSERTGCSGNKRSRSVGFPGSADLRKRRDRDDGPACCGIRFPSGYRAPARSRSFEKALPGTGLSARQLRTSGCGMGLPRFALPWARFGGTVRSEAEVPGHARSLAGSRGVGKRRSSGAQRKTHGSAFLTPLLYQARNPKTTGTLGLRSWFGGIHCRCCLGQGDQTAGRFDMQAFNQFAID